jgi:DNA-binding YbaB/EbfC family protein
MKGGIGDLMRQAQLMKETMKKAQAELATLEVTGEAGGTMVKVVLNGKHEAQRVTIDPRLMTEEKDMLEDLLAAAYNDAVRKIAASTEEKYSGLMSGLNLPPGVKLPF